MNSHETTLDGRSHRTAFLPSCLSHASLFGHLNLFCKIMRLENFLFYFVKNENDSTYLSECISRVVTHSSSSLVWIPKRLATVIKTCFELSDTRHPPSISSKSILPMNKIPDNILNRLIRVDLLNPKWSNAFSTSAMSYGTSIVFWGRYFGKKCKKTRVNHCTLV